jgi:hypothetical protein
MEGVVWGIEVDESGQARLVFWTENSIGPEYMDWELQPYPPEHKAGVRDGFRRALNAPVTEMEQHWKDIRQRMEKRLLDFNVPPDEIKKALKRALLMPIEAMAVAFVEEQKNKLREWVLEETSGVRKSVEKLEQQLEELRSFSFDVLLSAKRRTLQGFKDITDIEVITVTAPITARDRARLQQFKQVLMGMGLSEEQALHYAGLAMSVFDQFPRNLPFFTSMGKPQNPEARLNSSRTPVLQALLASLWMYPPAGAPVEADGVRIESRFMLDDKHVRLAVTLSRATGDTGTSVA